MAWAKRVADTPPLISKQSLGQCVAGIRSRIYKEKRRISRAPDVQYERNRQDNVHRLEIIKTELSLLYDQL